MRCRNCGAELVAGAAYCHACGAKVAEASTQVFSVSSDDLEKRVKDLIREGNVTRIVVKDESGRELIAIPATVGVLGALLAPTWAALGVIAALATRCTLVVERQGAKTAPSPPPA